MFKESNKLVFIATRKDKSPNPQHTFTMSNLEAAPAQGSSNLDYDSLMRKERIYQMGPTLYPLKSSMLLMGWQEKGQSQLWELLTVQLLVSNQYFNLQIKMLPVPETSWYFHFQIKLSVLCSDMWSLHPAEKQCFQKQKWKAKFIQLQAENKDNNLKGTIIILFPSWEALKGYFLNWQIGQF